MDLGKYKLGDIIKADGKEYAIKGIHLFINRSGESTVISYYVGDGKFIPYCEVEERGQ
jgi:hypothetical protein